MFLFKGKKIADCRTDEDESTTSDVSELFVRMENVEKDGNLEWSYGWYKLSEWNVEGTTNIVSPCFKIKQPYFHYCSVQVAVGPFIFVIGGIDFRENNKPRKEYEDVYVIDTRNPGKGWKKGPNLMCARGGTVYAFVLGHTICVFGGSRIECYPYGEVLDLQTGAWKLFKTGRASASPTCILGHGVLYMNHNMKFDKKEVEEEEKEATKRIWYEYTSAKFNPYPKQLYLHGARDDLHCYDFHTSQWDVTKLPIHLSSNLGYPTASVDDNLFVFGPKLMGYSMSEGEWFDVSLSGFDKFKNSLPPWGDVWTTPPSFLVHLGNGLLCILWVNYHSSPPDLVLHCTKFTVKVESEYGQLSAVANVKIYKTYTLPPGTVVDCVAVSTSSTITSFPFMRDLSAPGEVKKSKDVGLNLIRLGLILAGITFTLAKKH